MVYKFRNLLVIEHGIGRITRFLVLLFSFVRKIMFLFLVVYFLTSSTPPPGIYSTFIAYSNKLKRKLLLLIKINRIRNHSGLFLLSRCCLSRFRTLSSVFRTSLSTSGYTCCIKSTANDVVTYTRKVFHTTTANQYD